MRLLPCIADLCDWRLLAWTRLQLGERQHVQLYGTSPRVREGHAHQ